MTATPGAVARTIAVITISVVLQLAGVGGFRILGGSIDLIPLAVGGIAFLAGAAEGAIAGFLAGLMLDIAIGQTLGASSLVLAMLGYAVGRFRELRDPAHGLIPVAVAGLVTAGYLIGEALISLMLGVEASISPLVLRQTFVGSLLNAAIGIAAFRLIARILRPVLISDPFLRRRRDSTIESGPIGLRGLEV